MFTTDQPKVAEIASSSAEGYQQTVLLAIVSAQLHFAQIPQAFDDIRQQGETSGFLWAHKREGYYTLQDDDPFIHQRLAHWQTDPDTHWREAFRHFLSYPGLGLVKAGFCVQMTLGRVGCLDTHNVVKFKIPKKVYRPRAEYSDFVLDRYVAECAKHGTPQSLWDNWCYDMAARYPDDFNSAETVSSAHWRWLA